jgi:predicted DNA-binding protein YlxM (UPF0122 family)
MVEILQVKQRNYAHILWLNGHGTDHIARCLHTSEAAVYNSLKCIKHVRMSAPKKRKCIEVAN